MENIMLSVFAGGALMLGTALGVFIQRNITSKRIGEANDLARRIVDEARKEAQAQKKEILLQGQNEVFSQKHALETEYKEQERALKNREKKLQDISDRMEEKMERITQKEHDILIQEKEQNQRERLISEKETLLESKLDSFPEKEDIISRIAEEEASITLTLKEDYHENGGRDISEIISDLNYRMRLPNIYTRISAGASAPTQSGAASAMSGFMDLLGVGDGSERIVIKGSDFDMMDVIADDIRYYLGEMEFIASTWATNPGRRREIHLTFDPITLASYDISRQNITSALGSLGRELSTGTNLKLDTEEFEIVIKEDLTEEQEEKLQNIPKTVDDLRKVMIEDANGGLHELASLASIKYTRDISRINRVNRDREITITYTIDQSENLPKDVLEGYRDEIDQLIAGYNLPSGIAIQVDRTNESMSEFKFLIIASLILIYMILASVFQSVSTPFVLLFTIPLAAIGSLLGLLITGNPLQNANTLTGFLILLGVVVNNGIILIDYASILRQRGYGRHRALITSGFSRLRPILITTITTVIAMLPMAMGDTDYAGAIGAPFHVTSSYIRQ